MAFRIFVLLVIQTLFLAGCKETGGEIVGYVNGVLNRASLKSSASSVSLVEGSKTTITIHFDHPITKATTLDWSIDANASEFAAISGRVSVPLDAEQVSFDLVSADNIIVDGARTYTLRVSGSMIDFTNDLLFNISLTDNDSRPVISIANASVLEGTGAGTTNLTLTITASHISADIIEVHYTTSDGTAVAGSDYTSTSGTATIAAGQTSTNVSVSILRDSVFESDETLTITLSGGSGYTALGSTLSAMGTILNDDPPGAIWNFATTTDYTYDSNYIDLSSGTKASLKTVNTRFNDSTTFNTGTHVGTLYSGGALKLDSLTGADTSLSSSWTPKWSSLVRYWKMDGNWSDGSGNGAALTPIGHAAPTGVAKVGLSSGSFDGNGDGASAASSNVLSATSQASICWWMKWAPTTVSVDGSILQLYDGSDGWVLWVDSVAVQSGRTATVSFAPQMSAGTGGRVEGPTNLVTPGMWDHYCGTFLGGSAIRLFKNGELVASQTTGVVPTFVTVSATLSLGIASDLSSTSFNGQIDDLAVWTATLSASDVALIYNRQKQKYAGSYDSPVINRGSPLASWTSLESVSPLPFYKALPTTGSAESSAAYSGVVDSLGATGQGSDLTESLVAYWHFDERSGTSFADSIGSATGTKGASGTLSFSSSPINGGIGFDGTSAYISTSKLGNFGSSLAMGFTVSGYIKTSNITNTMIWIGTTNNGSKTNWQAGVNMDCLNSLKSGALRFSVRDQSGRTMCHFANFNTGVSDGRWHHVVYAVTPATKTIQIYLDGLPLTLTKTTDDGPSDFSGNFDFPVYIGAINNRGSAGSYFQGYLDEVGIWNRPLSNSEVVELYRRGANRLKYQVRSCVDSSCACKAFSTSPAGSASDCDGDGVANTSDTSDSYAADWIGPDGTASTYFSELQNTTSVDSVGNPTGSVNPAGLNLDWSGSFFSAAARPRANPYFQYRVYMESDDENNLCSSAPCLPEVTSITVGPTNRYYGGSPTIVNNTAIDYSQLQTMIKSDTNACTTYQLSTDHGSTWKWWNGSAWAAASGGVSTSNYLSDLTSSRLQTLSAGNYKFKAFLNTNTAGDFTQSCDLNSVEISYTP